MSQNGIILTQNYIQLDMLIRFDLKYLVIGGLVLNEHLGTSKVQNVHENIKYGPILKIMNFKMFLIRMCACTI